MNELFAYLKDNNYPIDNNQVYPNFLITGQSETYANLPHSILHFGSDKGEMVATYYSVINTVKMQGQSAREFFK